MNNGAWRSNFDDFLLAFLVVSESDIVRLHTISGQAREKCSSSSSLKQHYCGTSAV